MYVCVRGNAARFFGLLFFGVFPRLVAEFVRFSPLSSDSSSGRTPSLARWGRGWGCFLWLKGGNAVRFSVGIFFRSASALFDKVLLILPSVFKRVVRDELFVCDKFSGANF